MRKPTAWTRLRATALMLVLISAGYGCGRDRDAGDAARGADGELRVSDVTLGRSIGTDNRVTNRTAEFGNRDTIYAVVETGRATAGGTVGARWTFEDGQVVDESSRSVPANSESVTEFHIVNPAGWPTGRYRVEILTNGTVARTEEFTVR